MIISSSATPTWVAVSLLAASWSAASLANPTQCSYGALTRNIQVVYSDPGQPVPCEVIYNKSMESSVATLWRATSEAGYCEAQAEALIEKLSGFGWRCEATPAVAAELPEELQLETTEAAPATEPELTELLGDDPVAADSEPEQTAQ